MLAFLLTCSVPLIGFWYWSYTSVLQHEIDEVEERHLLIARNLGAALDRYHGDLTSAFDVYSAAITTDEDVGFFQPLFQKLNVRNVCVYNAGSGLLQRAFLAASHPCAGAVDGAQLEMFRGLLAARQNSGTAISPVTHAADGAAVLYAVNTAMDYLVIGAVGTGYFRELGSRINFGRMGHAAIVDQTGRVLAHPLKDWEAEARDISAVSTVQRMLAGESGVGRFYSPALKGDMVAGFNGATASGWGVMVPQPIDELEETATKVSRSAYVVLIVGVVLAATIATFFTTVLARPVNDVAAVARRM